MQPALTPEARENQMIYLATELAEKQLREGTASSQIIAHFLKLGSTKEKLEKEILESQADLLKAKKKSIESSERSEDMYKDAINAFRGYTPTEDDGEEDEF